MKIQKRTLLAGAAVAAVGLASVGTIGMVSAATPADGSAGTSIVDKLVSKFSLNKDEVQAVFNEAHTERKAEMQADQKERLAQAVTDGKLTQDQADYITKAQAEIEALMGDKRPDEQDETVRTQIKAKMDALRTWAEENNVDMRYAGHGGRGGPGGYGGGRGGEPAVTDDSSNDSTSSDDSATDS